MLNVYIEMGRVLEAHNNRFYVRQKNRLNPSNVKQATREYNQLGFYEDCGDFYREELDRAKENARTWCSMKISAEKHFKKRHLSFNELFPEYVDELNKQLDVQSRNHTNIINQQIAAKIAEQKHRELQRKIKMNPWKYNEDGSKKKLTSAIK